MMNRLMKIFMSCPFVCRQCLLLVMMMGLTCMDIEVPEGYALSAGTSTISS